MAIRSAGSGGWVLRGLSLVFALLLAVLPDPAPARQTKLDRAVERLFRPYSKPPTAQVQAVWERPIWSRETATLIARWRKITPEDEVDDLSDGDWLCQCQDWDEHAFRLKIVSREIDPTGHTAVEVLLNIAPGPAKSIRLLMVDERDGWKLDDFVERGLNAGIQDELRRVVEKDRHR